MQGYIQSLSPCSEASCLRQLSAVHNGHLLGGGTALGADLLDSGDHIHALGHGAKHNVLAVQPLGLHGGQEELGAVGVGASVGHGQEARASVLQLKVLHMNRNLQRRAELGVAVPTYLISELGAVDALTTSAIEVGEVTALQHELGDHTVEDGALQKTSRCCELTTPMGQKHNKP